jgi:hypothetical protein
LRCRKSLHPGVSLWSLVESGDPSRVASDHDGCGAAMRAAPVGVLFPPSRLDELVRGAYQCSIPTHGGQAAICAAAAAWPWSLNQRSRPPCSPAPSTPRQSTRNGSTWSTK